MSKSRWSFVTILSVLLIAVFALSACQTAVKETPAGKAATEANSTEAASSETAATEASATPTVGGTFVFANIEEPDTLDIYKSSFSVTDMVTSNIGAALVSKNTDGKIIPYLAESWEISEDGLVYTFHLRKDVKFHNGEPLTAKDFEWTWNRCLAEDFVCPTAGPMLAVFTKIKALDDYTLELTLDKPSYYTLSNLTSSSYLQPLNQKAVEAAGESYGMGATAVGVGPYMVKEWIQDEKIVLTRNPDFTWGPEYFEGANTGPYYVENYEFRVVPDLATRLAGLEANEIDYSSVEPKDLQTITDTGFYQIFDIDPSGFLYYSFNMKNEKFADLKVRQALNMAIDRELLLQVVLNGNGTVLDGPMAGAMMGYDESVMKGTGPVFDLEKAKSLMEEAGYTYGEDGMLVGPDGSPFGFTLTIMPDEQTTKIATIAVDLWKQLGVAVTIEQLEWGTMAPKVFSGDYEVCYMGMGWPDADIMYVLFHSSQIGSLNFAFVEDADLDALLDTARNEIDDAAHQEAVNAAYKMIQNKSYMIPLYYPLSHYAVSNDFQGVKSSPFTGFIFSDMYYTGE